MPPKVQTNPQRVGPEFCAKHKEANVGMLKDDKQEIVCNTCIFEKKLMGLKFTSLVSKDLRGEFNSAFNEYKSGLNSVSGVDTDLVK